MVSLILGLISDFFQEKMYKEMKDMYKKDPKYGEDEEYIFHNSGLCVFYGIVIILFFSASMFIIDNIIEWLGEFTPNLYDILYNGIVVLFVFFILIGIRFIFLPFTKKILFKKNEVVYKGLILTKTIKFEDITIIKFSKVRGLIIKSKNTCIVFGSFMKGLIYVLKLIEENVDNSKCEDAIRSAKKMLKRNQIEFE